MTDRSESWLEAVRQIVAAVQASDVTELELANAEFSVRLRRAPTTSVPAPAESDSGHEQLHGVAAPFTGVFYRSPTPSARVYVNEGDWVEADSVIGLVETMKVFNEVSADISGRIIRFAADNGQLVHAGEVLMLMEPGDRVLSRDE